MKREVHTKNYFILRYVVFSYLVLKGKLEFVLFHIFFLKYEFIADCIVKKMFWEKKNWNGIFFRLTTWIYYSFLNFKFSEVTFILYYYVVLLNQKFWQLNSLLYFFINFYIVIIYDLNFFIVFLVISVYGLFCVYYIILVWSICKIDPLLKLL